MPSLFEGIGCKDRTRLTLRSARQAPACRGFLHVGIYQDQILPLSSTSGSSAAQASVEQQIAHVKSLQATLGQDKADQQASVATMKRENMGDAAGLTSLVRNLGGSVGISLVTAFVTRGTQAHQDLLVGHLTQFAAPFRNQLAILQHALSAQSGQAALMKAAWSARCEDRRFFI